MEVTIGAKSTTPDNPGGGSCTDADPRTWYHDGVHYCIENGLMRGYGNALFGPNDPITREQFAVMLYRHERRSGGFTGTWMFRLDFTNADDVSDWAYEAMCWCSMNGIVEGTGHSVLEPKGNAARAEAAAMLIRYFELDK